MLLTGLLSGCGIKNHAESRSSAVSASKAAETESEQAEEPAPNAAAEEKKDLFQGENMQSEADNENKIRMQIGDSSFTVSLEENASTEALKALLANGPLAIRCSNYGGFEKACSLGTEIPSNDVRTTTSSGDVMLYNSNQIVIFYSSNSWAYTRLGRVDEEYLDQLKDILSGKETDITLSLD